VKETAVMLGCSIRHTYKMLYEHQIPGFQLGTKWIIYEERLHQWLMESAATPPILDPEFQSLIHLGKSR
jgi:excisionase family DNA binding protein